MTLTGYLLNLSLVGLVVLQLRGRKVTVAGLLVPLVVTVWVASQYLHGLPTAGNDLVLELGFGAVGALLGGLAALATTIRRDGSVAIAKAGALAACLWVLGIGARMGFALWVDHGGQHAVASFSVTHDITTADAWATAFILMAITEVASRTLVLFAKTRRSGAAIPRGGMLRTLASA